MIREICKGLPVELDICLFQPAHELTVIQSRYTYGSADSGNPERPELTLFGLSVAIGVLECFVYSLRSYPEKTAFRAVISLGPFKDLLSSSSCLKTTFCPGHLFLL